MPQLVLPITGPPGPPMAVTTGPTLDYLVWAGLGLGLGLGLDARAILISTCASSTDAGGTT